MSIKTSAADTPADAQNTVKKSSSPTTMPILTKIHSKTTDSANAAPLKIKDIISFAQAYCEGLTGRVLSDKSFPPRG